MVFKHNILAVNLSISECEDLFIKLLKLSEKLDFMVTHNGYGMFGFYGDKDVILNLLSEIRL